MAPSKSNPRSLPAAQALWARLEALEGRRPVALGKRRILGRKLRDAAVLVPVYRREGRPHLLFTKRSEDLPSHRGEISFPGGGREAGDADLGATALRETYEELGIPTATVRIIAPVDDVWSLHGYRVTPFVAEIPPTPVPRVNAAEVAEVIEVDLLRLMDEKLHRQSRMQWLGEFFDIHYYDYDGHTIWGMTGVIVHRLLRWLRGEEA